MKMVDQMEELHENLAELDARFERYVYPTSEKTGNVQKLSKNYGCYDDIAVIFTSLLRYH